MTITPTNSPAALGADALCTAAYPTLIDQRCALTIGRFK
jgi:hypothetical protein